MKFESMVLCALIFVHTSVQRHIGKYEQQCGLAASSNPIHQYPFLVYLELHRHHQHIAEIMCAGTLIDRQYVVTAAHCVKRHKHTRIVARLGEYNVTSELDCVDDVCADPVLKIPIVDVIYYPDYNGFDHDIALLRLKTEAPYTDFIRPACLPSGDLDENTLFYGSGWGELPSLHRYADIKKNVPLSYWPKEKCKKIYSYTVIPRNVICAGGKKDLDMCRGDSGGPLVLAKERVELWGITSTGNVNCGAEGTPGIYTSVKDHLEWIKEIMETKRHGVRYKYELEHHGGYDSLSVKII